MLFHNFSRGTRVTHVKIPFDSATKVYRLPTGQEFQSIDTIVPYLEAHPKLLSEADGFSIEVTSSVQIPIAETVVYIGRDRMSKNHMTIEFIGLGPFEAIFTFQPKDRTPRIC